jgi:hypothetical protein
MSSIMDPRETAGQKPAERKRRSLAELLEAFATRPTLDAEEIGAGLGIGTSTVYRLIGNGTIPSFRIPNTSVIRVRRIVLDELLRTWEQGGRRRGRKAQEGAHINVSDNILGRRGHSIP